VTFAGGSPLISISKRSPPSPKLQAGSRCSSPISQFTRAVTTGAPRTVPCQVKRCAATLPGASVPTGDSIGALATAISWCVRVSGSRSKPNADATMRIDCSKPPPRMRSIGLFAATSGGFPKSITSRTTFTAA